MATRTQNQVVRLTRCLDVPGHTAMLVRVMTEAGYRWYPEYTLRSNFETLIKASISALSGYFHLILDPPSLFTASSLLLWTRGYYRDGCAGCRLLYDDHHASQDWPISGL